MLALALPASKSLHAQRPPIGPAVRSYVRVDTAIFALTNARVIDGTGASAREAQTVVERDGRIVTIGATGAVTIPSGAQIIDLTGRSLIPARIATVISRRLLTVRARL